MLILPANGSERAWFGLSARSRYEATAVTIGHQHEAFPRSFAADAINRSSSDGRGPDLRPESGDRKSTRLNSSHSQISYAVFCLKKKTTLRHRPQSYSIPSRLS